MRCENCNISFQSDTGNCPLCHEKIGCEKDAFRLYPPRAKTITKNQLNSFTRLYLFLTAIVFMVTATVNFLTIKKFNWSLVALFSMLYVFALIRNTILAKSNIAFKIVSQAVLMSLLLYAIDFYLTSGNKWSLEYAVPFVLILSTLSLTILAYSNYAKWRDYVLYILSTVLIGFVLFIFYLTDIIDIYWPSLTAFLYSVFTILGMIVFYRKKLTNELKKNFHV